MKFVEKITLKQKSITKAIKKTKRKQKKNHPVKLKSSGKLKLPNNWIHGGF